MSLHINRFIDRIKASDSRGQKDFIMSMSEAKDLHADITKLLLALHVSHEQQAQQTAGSTQSQTIEIDGGSF